MVIAGNGRFSIYRLMSLLRSGLDDFLYMCIMCIMSEEIEPNTIYTTKETADILGMHYSQIQRLFDAGHFEGAYRKAPVPRSPRQIPGSAIIKFLEQRKNI